jgi:hypothetical protein
MSWGISEVLAVHWQSHGPARNREAEMRAVLAAQVVRAEVLLVELVLTRRALLLLLFLLAARSKISRQSKI